MFLLLEMSGGSQNTDTLIRFGAKENSLLLAGEWWRLVTPIVLHIGLVHLMFNTFALLSVGAAAERVFGSFRFLVIYISAGILDRSAAFCSARIRPQGLREPSSVVWEHFCIWLFQTGKLS